MAEYAKQVMDAVWPYHFEPLMTMYLTDTLDRDDVADCLKRRAIAGVKYYPRGLTTNSDSGVKDPASLWTDGTEPCLVLRTLAEHGGVLLIHAADGVDKNGDIVDPDDQEKHFIRETLPRIIDAHPNLKISVEHLSTKEGAAFMYDNGNERLGCTITAQHLLLDRRDTMKGGLQTHMFWWPIIQHKEDREALQALATSGKTFVYLGSDSAPHPKNKKEAACCIGGVLMAHAGIEFYAEAFDKLGSLDKLEDFASINGPRFYGRQPSGNSIELTRNPWIIREWFYAGADEEPIRPFRLGGTVDWKLTL